MCGEADGEGGGEVANELVLHDGAADGYSERLLRVSIWIEMLGGIQGEGVRVRSEVTVLTYENVRTNMKKARA